MAVELAYELHTNPEKPIIVFLHGGGWTGWAWDRQVSALSGYQCVTVDLPGSGESAHIPWRSLNETADSVAQLISEVAGTERVHVVGLSVGGDVALRLLDRHPSKIRSAFISGVVTSKVTGVPRAIQQVASLIAGTRVFHRLAAKSMGLVDSRREEFLSTVPRFSRSSYTRMVRDVFAGVPLDGLAACAVPTLVIASEKEPLLAAESARDVSCMMPNAVSAIANGVGHAWNIQSPELFNSSVDAWFSQHAVVSGLSVI
ncbi:alpha/beta fold hydrolase [Salinibacterium sp. NYA9b]